VNSEESYGDELEDSDEDDENNDHYFEMDAPDYQVRAMYRGEGDEFDIDPWVFFGDDSDDDDDTYHFELLFGDE